MSNAREPHYSDDAVTLHRGDCLDVLRSLPDASVDSVVCDPPYGLANTTPEQVADTLIRWINGERDYLPQGQGFMGKAWDAFVPPVAVWDDCLRVLKPGGHLLAFAGSRTHDLMTLAIRMAGFDIRDSIAWLYGSGFPKSLDVSKAIDKAAGATREVVGTRVRLGDSKTYAYNPASDIYGADNGAETGHRPPLTAPATPAAQQWQGWGTALKPAFEPVVVARKPLLGTVAQTVLAHGTGALNVDGCRVGTGGGGGNGLGSHFDRLGDTTPLVRHGDDKGGSVGRWPTNVVLDGHAAEELDRQSGTSKSSIAGPNSGGFGGGMFGDGDPDRIGGGYTDSGGASRFFPTFRYQAKAPTRERVSYVKEGAGTGRVTGLGGKVRQCNVCETRAIESGAKEPSCGHGDFRWEEPTTDTGSKVAHPTVKPLALMQWLVRLVTPPGGVVLEPFAGSGTTVEACLLEGFRCIAIEREADYLPLIEARIARQRKPDVPNAAEALALFDFEEPA